ncbi:MAG TPA: MutS family DNA mismatch repair protein, partial [Nitrolancea sp.]|nr:MutS family DNA mismatch repair protein [Nitrolancea sp.]
PFHAPILKRLQTELRTGGVPAHQHLRRLHRLVTLVIPGSAIIHWLVQSVTLWDVHVLAALERWQAKAGDQARAWLAALSEIEALAALAVLAHDNPDWAFPDLDPDAQSLVARDLGHPLLPRSVRVLNDVEVGPPGTFLLVTGSNMSGKSTLLRALGVNIALAQAGGPVCASELRLPAVDLWTSMRIQDSLAMGVSYFMAELQRLKQIVDAARQNNGRAEIKTFYLLDEILQGTNTFERQIAARRIIRCLVDLGAIGAVSTHDLTLVDADELAEVAHSTYFTETISTDPARPAMSFDYKLHPGIATSSNALKLMKLIGLNTDVTAKS